MPVARIVGGIGRVLIAAGLLILLFVAYQLYGTGLTEARAQDDLRDDFAASLTTTTSPTTTAVEPEGAAPTTATVAPTTTQAPRPEGEAVALIRIPAVGIDKAVVEGVSVADLKKGPGHYPGTPLPGQPGNAAIAGHRTTYGAPFGELGEVVEGDEVLVTTREGEFRYVVDRITVVAPSQIEVLAPTEEARITLTTCHPRYSARQRLIVSGVLTSEPAAPAPQAPTPQAPAAPPDDQDAAPPAAAEEDSAPAEVPGDEPTLSLDDPSLSGDPSARTPAAAWGAATGLVALAAWFLGRRWHRWPAYLLALPLGAFTLFHCFEHVARLLPAAI